MGQSYLDQITEQGFAKVPGALSPAMLEELRGVTANLLEQMTPEQKEKFKYQGSDIHLSYQHPVLTKLIALPAALDALASMGFAHPKFLLGTIISKPGGGKPLYWHQDWAYWDHPISGEVAPAQLFLMYYLTDTSPENGCLRVIPKTHTKRIPFHAELPEAHAPATYQATLDSPSFRIHPEEVDVAVKAGDLLIGDARLLHAAHANKTQNRRTLLTLWYLPRFDELPEDLKAAMIRTALKAPPAKVSDEERQLIEPLLASYTGSAKPTAFNRVPGKYLV